MSRINDKIKEIEKYLEELMSVLPKNFEDYKHDWKIRDICKLLRAKALSVVVQVPRLHN